MEVTQTTSYKCFQPNAASRCFCNLYFFCLQADCSTEKKKTFKRGKICAAYGCSNTNYFVIDGQEVLSKITMFSVPQKVLKDPRSINRWASLLKRQHNKDGFTMNKHTVVCEKHFREDDVQRKSGHGLTLKNPKLKEGAEPLLHSWNTPKPRRPSPKKRCSAQTTRASKKGKKSKVEPAGPPTVEAAMELTPASKMCETSEETPAVSEQANLSSVSGLSSPTFVSVGTQTVETSFDKVPEHMLDHDYTFVIHNAPSMDSLKDYISMLEAKLHNCTLECRELKKIVQDLTDEVTEFRSRRFSIFAFEDDDAAVRFYTGMPNFASFIALFKYLEPKAEKLQYWRGTGNGSANKPYQRPGRRKPGPARKCSLLDEFFLVMVRLRVGLFTKDLALRFEISESTVSRVFTTWINFLSREIPLLFPTPSQSRIRHYMPPQFNKFPTTRIILDCTEIFVEVPSAMKAQSETWSNYKHHNTWKVLVGVTPNGQVSFVSELWGGRVTDKKITFLSGVFDFLEPGDNVMADRGFEIQDILPPGVDLNIPPFKGSREALTAEEVQATMEIAEVRIHVERAIGRIKNYHILDGVMPLSLAPVADQIFRVCAYMTNFQTPLVKVKEKVPSDLLEVQEVHEV
ncbi:uncharacterized protein LOC144869803 isoform X1 [Branchiostoma floridae x Branchiostoma japonicum]